jgi:hypothetical protein
MGMPPYLLTPAAFDAFLERFHAGMLSRQEWNHAAHLAVAAAIVHRGGGGDAVRQQILVFNHQLGIVSSPESGYHETVTRFWVERLAALLPALGRGATAFDTARAALAAFAHRARLFDAYYSFDIVSNRTARAHYVPPDLVISSGHDQHGYE